MSLFVVVSGLYPLHATPFLTPGGLLEGKCVY